MHEKKQKRPGRFLARPVRKPPARGFAIPFFVVLFLLTVVSFIIPLRPTQSMNEKRNLAEFPEFTLEALSSGSYFDDITLWFSDTFPGRDSWISLSAYAQELHGIQDVVIYGELSVQETVPDVYVPPATEETKDTEPEQTVPETTEVTEPEETVPETTEPVNTTPPTTPVEEWGGVDAGDDAQIHLGNVIQIGDTAFNYFSFTQHESDRFIGMMTDLQKALSTRENVKLVTALIPTSVGVMVEEEYQEKIGCADQSKAIKYVYSGIPDDVVKVDMFDTLVEHNNEYIYFRTDHHWTALGAYYAYTDICEALDMEAAPLDTFEVWDQGEYKGTNYYQTNQSDKLRLDKVYAYNPPGDISMIINNDDGRFSWTVLTDMSKSAANTKYMTFLAGDHALCEITNNDLPDAPNCVIVKDSFGNAIAPFFTQNFHNLYILDFRQYSAMNLQGFVDVYDIDIVIILLQTIDVNSYSYNNLVERLFGV